VTSRAIAAMDMMPCHARLPTQGVWRGNFELWRAAGDVEVDQSLRPTEIRRELAQPFARKSCALMQIFPCSLQNQYEPLPAECVRLGDRFLAVSLQARGMGWKSPEPVTPCWPINEPFLIRSRTQGAQAQPEITALLELGLLSLAA
jgi:hypothetical protein